MSDSIPDASEDVREGLGSRSFLGLLVTQFLGAFNDNMFRWLAVPIAQHHLGGEENWLALSAGLACFTVPYLIFAYPAGFLADRFSKRNIIVGCKIAEVAIMFLGIAAIYVGNIYLMFTVVAMMGCQSALFGPSKLGSIPEMLRVDKLANANGLMGLTTVIAAAAGCVAGNVLYAVTGADGTEGLWISALALIGVAAFGLAASLLIRSLPTADPDRMHNPNWPLETWRDLRHLGDNRAILRVALGIAFFWSLASLAQLNIDTYGKAILAVDQVQVGILLFVLVIGVGLGSVLAGIWSGGRIELGIVPLGALGIAISAMMLFTTQHSYLWTGIWLFGLGASGGLFDVPLITYLQHRSPKASRGAILAASNFVAFAGMFLVSIFFAVLQGPLELDAATVFLIAGLGTIPVTLYVLVLVPGATLRFVVWLTSHTVYRLRIHGREHLPEEGGALLVANHVSWLDGVFLLISSSRPIRILAYAPYMEIWPVCLLARIMRVIPIDPGGGPKTIMRSLRTARDAIEGGELVCIFAEGGITRTGQLQPFRPGLMRIIKGTGAPVIPVYLDELWGSIFSFRGGKAFWKWPRQWPYPVSILFGPHVSNPNDVLQVRRAVQKLGAQAMDMRKLRQRSLPRAFLRKCRKHLRRPVVADSTGEHWTGCALLARTLILRRLLLREVLADDEDMVGVILPPSLGGVLVNAALPLARRVPVNLNYTASKDVLNSCIRQCNIRHVLTSKKVIERLNIELDATLVFVEDLIAKIGPSDKFWAACQAILLPARLQERLLGIDRVGMDDLLTVMFTSGSTGDPKGVMLSHANVAANIESVSQIINLSSDDVILGVLPFFHSYGFTCTLWTCLALEPQGVFHHNPLDGRTVGQLCEKHKVTILLATPTFLRAYLRRCERQQFTTMEVLFASAERLPSELADAFEEKLGIRPLEAYGATELSPLASANVPDRRAGGIEQIGRKEGTVGHPVPMVCAKVVDPETWQELGVDEPGMLLIHGPNVMKGYLGRPEQTAEVIRDGWYVTGDIAQIDDDGFITITDRLSRFSKIGGEMVPHLKIEESLGQIIGGNDMLSVVTAVPDAKKGERLIVVHKHFDLGAGDVCKRLADAGLPKLWIPSPDSFLEVEEIPVLGSGKVDLKSLKQLAIERFGSKQ